MREILTEDDEVEQREMVNELADIRRYLAELSMEGRDQSSQAQQLREKAEGLEGGMPEEMILAAHAKAGADLLLNIISKG